MIIQTDRTLHVHVCTLHSHKHADLGTLYFPEVSGKRRISGAWNSLSSPGLRNHASILSLIVSELLRASHAKYVISIVAYIYIYYNIYIYIYIVPHSFLRGPLNSSRSLRELFFVHRQVASCILYVQSE